jgi:hypothetical protein
VVRAEPELTFAPRADGEALTLDLLFPDAPVPELCIESDEPFAAEPFAAEPAAAEAAELSPSIDSMRHNADQAALAELAEPSLEPSVNSKASDDLLWRSQLETQDPFLSELAELIAGAADGPLGIFEVVAAPCSAVPSQATNGQGAAYEPLEPISLEGFVSGEVLPLASEPTRLQALNALDLPLDIASLSSTEKAWDDVVQPLGAFLLERGATHAAIILPKLLAGDSVNVARLPRAAQQCLVAEDFASEHDGTVLIRPEFRARARRLHRAFRAGTLEAGALRRFVAVVARTLLATPLDTPELLQQLESAGVRLDERAA